MKFYQKILEIPKALEINLRDCHCLRYIYYDFKEKPNLLLQLSMLLS